MDNKVSQVFTSSIKNPTYVGVASFILGAATSAGVSYILNRRKATVSVHEEPNPIDFDSVELENVIRKHAQPEIDISEMWAHDPSDHIAPETLGKDFVEKKMEDSVIIVPESPEIVEIEPERRTIFAGSDDEWNFEEELASRSEASPHIIHVDEFVENETEYTQSSLIYYVGDDILVDEKESPIYNHHQVIGDITFGHGSGDPNIVYVRNDKRKAEYEIFKHEGSWTIDVLGMEVENNAQARDLKHSKHTVPRFHNKD